MKILCTLHSGCPVNFNAQQWTFTEDDKVPTDTDRGHNLDSVVINCWCLLLLINQLV